SPDVEIEDGGLGSHTDHIDRVVRSADDSGHSRAMPSRLIIGIAAIQVTGLFHPAIGTQIPVLCENVAAIASDKIPVKWPNARVDDGDSYSLAIVRNHARCRPHPAYDPGHHLLAPSAATAIDTLELRLEDRLF